MGTVYVPSSCRETTAASLVNFLSPDRCTFTLKPAGKAASPAASRDGARCFDQERAACGKHKRLLVHRAVAALPRRPPMLRHVLAAQARVHVLRKKAVVGHLAVAGRKRRPMQPGWRISKMEVEWLSCACTSVPHQ